MRRAFHLLHRWVSLSFAAFWLVQAMSGMLLVYHWELTDFSYESTNATTDFVALSRRIDSLNQIDGDQVTAIWTTAGLSNRYKLYLSEGKSLVVAGDGTILDERNTIIPKVIDTALGLHHELLAGEAGQWLVGTSGAVLLTNLVLGIRLAWAKSGHWRRTLLPAQVSKGPAKNFSDHRAFGLWGAVAALVLIASGTLLRFEDGVTKFVGADATELVPVTPEGATFVSFFEAARAAIGAIPGSTLTAAYMPNEGDATYKFRLLDPDELRKPYGKSVVWVDANDATIRKIEPASNASWRHSFVNSLFAVHTGQAGGRIGRIATVLLATWLVVMIFLGVQLWRSRRTLTKAKRK